MKLSFKNHQTTGNGAILTKFNAIRFLFLFLLMTGTSCKQESQKISQEAEKPLIDQLIKNLKDSENNDVIVVAHRGDWRNAPENSLQAIQNCIDMGVDMVEIDIRETKDGHLVLMHDRTIDRTTKGKGLVKDFTLDSLKTFHLTNCLRVETPHKIPTLEEVLLLAKGKILVNLDKSYEIFNKCYEVAKRTNTLDQVIIKGRKTRKELESGFGKYLGEVYFMPIVKLPDPKAKEIVDDYLNHRIPIAFEFVFPQDTVKMINDFKIIRSKGSSIWVNSLWGTLNGNHDDERAVMDPKVYDWYIEHGVDIIQTDRPKLLIEYLKKKGLHR